MTTATNESSDNSLLPQFKILTLQFNQSCTYVSKIDWDFSFLKAFEYFQSIVHGYNEWL